jgi:hypothetical protein
MKNKTKKKRNLGKTKKRNIRLGKKGGLSFGDLNKEILRQKELPEEEKLQGIKLPNSSQTLFPGEKYVKNPQKDGWFKKSFGRSFNSILYPKREENKRIQIAAHNQSILERNDDIKNFKITDNLSEKEEKMLKNEFQNKLPDLHDFEERRKGLLMKNIKLANDELQKMENEMEEQFSKIDENRLKMEKDLINRCEQDKIQIFAKSEKSKSDYREKIIALSQEIQSREKEKMDYDNLVQSGSLKDRYNQKIKMEGWRPKPVVPIDDGWRSLYYK